MINTGKNISGFFLLSIFLTPQLALSANPGECSLIMEGKILREGVRVSSDKPDMGRGVVITSIETDEHQWNMYERTPGGSLRYRGEDQVGPIAYELLKNENLKESVVVDAGCGTGGFVRTLSRAGIEAYGIDLGVTPGQIKTGRFAKADVRDINQVFGEERVVDVIVSAYSIFRYPESVGFRTEVFESFAKVLKPGGYISISPYAPVNDNVERSVPRDWNGFNSYYNSMGRRLAPSTVENVRKELNKVFRKVPGFKIVEIVKQNNSVSVLIQRN